MSRIRALIYLFGLLLLSPFILLSVILVLVFAVALGVISGVCIAAFAFINCIKDCKLLGKLCCLVFLPIVIVLGLIIVPPACVCCLTIPISRKIVKKYKNTVSFVYSSLTK